jgi:Aerobic-type carbon monoxide dehydrogenase, small subunit CoxS/CutS homologs
MKEIKLKVDGVIMKVNVDDNEILLDVLRNKLGIRSVKAACWRGECGLCTVLLNGIPIKSCMMLAIEAEDQEIITAQGLYSDERARKLMDSFVRHGAMQCGFCTPAFIVTSHYILNKYPDADDDEINEGLKSAICRCGTYFQIKEAVKEAKKYYDHFSKS